jgi:diguanylate cyclase (GGDEF)-like protein
MRFLCAGGQVVVGRLQATAIRDAAGAPQHLVVHVLDMTERTRYEAQLQHMTDHDHLTGLLNRRRFEIELELAVAAGAHGDARGAVIVLDLDDFKEINHIVGHTGADELLVSVAGILRGRLRESDVLARLGGDEFAVLLPSADAIAAEATADALVTAVRSEASIEDRDRSRAVTASAGATTFEGGAGASADAVIRDAEFAMYDAKEAGRDGAAFFAQAHTGQSATKSRLAWVRRIERAIDDGSFVLYAQPILDLRANEITRFELLLRMLDDHGDRIPPDAFLPVAERHGLITRIDRWVIGEAIRRLAEAQASGTERCFEVNLSGASIGDRQLLDAITSELRNTGVTPSNLVFEITETAAVADIARARRFAQALRELGCRFALDDFGAGFGSFFYLKHLPFDYLKIDGEFISNCVEDRTDQLVVRAVVQVAEGLGKETIAEFVGDADTRRMVQRLGVDFAQGAHISMPVPLEQALLLAAGAEG